MLLERERALVFVVTTTTRAMRANELEGRDYFFVSNDEFERMVEAGEFVEHALVYGERKGVSRRQVQAALQSGKDALLRVDVQGAVQIKKLYPGALLIFVTPESDAELRYRLDSRETETDGGMKSRLRTAREEAKCQDEFDCVVVNRRDDLERTVNTIQRVVRTERARVRRRADFP
jgi:guanylate kinase